MGDSSVQPQNYIFYNIKGILIPLMNTLFKNIPVVILADYIHQLAIEKLAID